MIWSAWGGVQMWWLVPGARALGRDGGSGVPWTCDGVAVARGYPGVCEEGGWRWLAPRPGASAGGVLPSVNTCTGREFGSRPFPHAPLKQWRLASKAAGTSSTHTLSCGCSPIPASLGSFCMAILSPLPGLMSEAWVPAPVGACLRLGRAGRRHWLPVQLPLCSGCCSSLLRLWSSPPSWPTSLPARGLPRARNFSSLIAASWGSGPVLIPFSLSFFLLAYVEILLLFRQSEVFQQHLVGILWDLLHTQKKFLMYLWEK